MSYNVVNRTVTLSVVVLAISFAQFAAVAHAQSGAESDTPPPISIGPEQDREFEKRAQSLEKQLICPICPGETLDQSFVQISQDMKRIIREKLAEGQTEDEIKEFFVARYGTSVLAAPPRSGFNLVTWVLPPVAVVAGVLALVIVMRQMRRGSGQPVAAGVGGVGGSAADTGLSDYLAEVDRDLSLEEETDVPTERDDRSQDS